MCDGLEAFQVPHSIQSCTLLQRRRFWDLSHLTDRLCGIWSQAHATRRSQKPHLQARLQWCACGSALPCKHARTAVEVMSQLQKEVKGACSVTQPRSPPRPHKPPWPRGMRTYCFLHYMLEPDGSGDDFQKRRESLPRQLRKFAVTCLRLVLHSGWTWFGGDLNGFEPTR